MIAIGPCMLLAPLVFILALLAVPFWPVILALIGLTWLVLWPVERMAVWMGLRTTMGWTAAVGRVFRIVLTPWTYFDLPVKKEPQ